jgi:hypothetical protein
VTQWCTLNLQLQYNNMTNDSTTITFTKTASAITTTIISRTTIDVYDYCY